MQIRITAKSQAASLELHLDLPGLGEDTQVQVERRPSATPAGVRQTADHAAEPFVVGQPVPPGEVLKAPAQRPGAEPKKKAPAKNGLAHQKAEIIRLSEEGQSPADIAQALGMTKPAVNSALWRHRNPTKTGSNGPGRPKKEAAMDRTQVEPKAHPWVDKTLPLRRRMAALFLAKPDAKDMPWRELADLFPDCQQSDVTSLKAVLVFRSKWELTEIAEGRETEETDEKD